MGKQDTPPGSRLSALESILSATPEGLGEQYDYLRLLGAVVGQIALIDVAASAGPAERASAARALIKLDEEPENVAERLRASPFKDLDTKALQRMAKLLRKGVSPHDALRRVLSTNGK